MQTQSTQQHTAIPPSLENLRTEVTDIERRTRALAAQHPLATLGAALAFGYLLGRVLSRGLR